MSKKIICDRCGKEIVRLSNSFMLKEGEHIYLVQTNDYRVNNTNHDTWPEIDMCADCVKAIVSEGKAA